MITQGLITIQKLILGTLLTLKAVDTSEKDGTLDVIVYMFAHLAPFLK